MARDLSYELPVATVDCVWRYSSNTLSHIDFENTADL